MFRRDRTVLRVHVGAARGVKVEVLAPGEAQVYRDVAWEHLPALIERLKPQHVYVDELPEARRAHALKAKYPKLATIVRSGL